MDRINLNLATRKPRRRNLGETWGTSLGDEISRQVARRGPGGRPEQLARALTSPLTHSLFAAIWGLGLIHARLHTPTRGARFVLQALPLAASMLLHGFYDFLVIGPGATLPASGIVLGLWLWMILWARRVVPGRSRLYVLDR